MRYPEFLKPGGTIGFLAPSFGCATEPYKSAFNNALKFFEAEGYKTFLGPNCYAGEGLGISNKPEKCATELSELYASDSSDVLISCGGGELMCEILPYIDWELIKKSKPKWYMGYSDNTNFTYLSNVIADTAAIYGPCAPSFGMEPQYKSIKDAFELLKGNITSVSNYDMWEKESLKDEEHPLTPYNLTEKYAQRIFVPENNKMTEITDSDRQVRMEGRLLGGCVDILVNFLGTRFDKTDEFLEKYKDDGIIWFLECCDLTPMSIRRAFFQMKYAGWFRYAKGFIIGRPLHFGEEMMGVDQYNAVLDIINDAGCPVIMDTDIGHLPPQMPIISGAYADILAAGNKINITYNLK